MKLEQLRGELLRHGIEEGLTNNEVMLLWHILDFDFTSKGISWPGRRALADRMGFANMNSVTRMLAKLESKGLISRVSQVGTSNKYEWHGLITDFQKYVKPSKTPIPKDDTPTPERVDPLLPEDYQSSSRESLQRTKGSVGQETPDPPICSICDEVKKIAFHSNALRVCTDCAKQFRKEHQPPSPTSSKQPQNGRRVGSGGSAKKKWAGLEPGDPMDLVGFGEYCAKSKQSHIRLIGWWAEQVGASFKTAGRWKVFFDRQLRPARDVSNFSIGEITEALSRTKREAAKNGYEFTLETVAKKLTNGRAANGETGASYHKRLQ